MNRKKHEEQKDSILEPVAPTPSVSEEDGDSSDSTDRELRQIVETGSITVDKRGHYIHCLTVIGQIEGHYVLPAQNKTTKYEHVIPQLVAIEESRDIEGLLIILNTVVGVDAFENGLHAAYEQLHLDRFGEVVLRSVPECLDSRIDRRFRGKYDERYVALGKPRFMIRNDQIERDTFA